MDHQRTQELHQAMLGLYERSKNEIDYRPTRFLQMVRRRGGLEAARRAITSRHAMEGLSRLLENNRPDLSVEALVLSERFAVLFSPEEKATAERNLKRASAIVKSSD